MITKRKTADTLRHDIAVRAYLIWEGEGRPHGREAEHWHKAEAEILGAKKKPAKKKAEAPAAKPVAKPAEKPIEKPAAKVPAKAAAKSKAKSKKS